MRDSEVVAAIVAGDPAGLAEAYDRYAAPLYSFCRTLLREPADAADAVQDTFVIAMPALSGLRDPERLRSWLYAVARNQCHRRLRGGSQQAPLDEVPDSTDEAADVGAEVEKAELRALVHRALSGLGPAEREVLELQLRQGLSSGEVAAVLGVSRNHVHALLSRARDQLEASLGVLLVAGVGRRDCAELDAMLENWDGQLTVLLRKRVGRHLDRCPVCSGRRHQELTPAMLLGVAPVAALPLAAALPAGLRDQVLQLATGHSSAAAYRAAVSETAHALGRHGFPQPLDPPRMPWWHPGALHAGTLASAASAAAVVAAGVTFAVAPPHHAAHPAVTADGGVTSSAGATAGAADPTVTGRAGSSARTDHTVQASTTASPSPALSDRPSAGATLSPSPSPSPSPSESETTSAGPAAGTLTVSPAELDLAGSGFGVITLTASGGPVTWSVSEPAGQAGKLIVTPASGTLAAGDSTTVSVTVNGQGKQRVRLVFTPGSTTVTVVIG